MYKQLLTEKLPKDKLYFFNSITFFQKEIILVQNGYVCWNLVF